MSLGLIEVADSPTNSAQQVVVKNLQWGFVVAESPTRSADFHFVFAELPVPSVQFCRMRVCSSDHRNAREYVLVSAYPLPLDRAARASAEQALTAEYAQASIVFVIADRVGRAELDPQNVTDPTFAAAATAVMKACGAWDESNPIEVVIGEQIIRLHPHFDGSSWLTTIYAEQ